MPVVLAGAVRGKLAGFDKDRNRLVRTENIMVFENNNQSM